MCFGGHISLRRCVFGKYIHNTAHARISCAMYFRQQRVKMSLWSDFLMSQSNTTYSCSLPSSIHTCAILTWFNCDLFTHQVAKLFFLFIIIFNHNYSCSVSDC